MFINDYNPLYDDVFIYSGFNGYPIGLNTNHPLYEECKNSLISIEAKNRVYGLNQSITPINPDYPSGPPVGVPESQYTNYWNNSKPNTWFISTLLIGSAIHFFGNYPSDSFPLPVSGNSKKTTLIVNSTVKFLAGTNTSSLITYGPFYNIYNYASENDLYDTLGLQPHYFTGSPEIPGYESGATFYQVLSQDFGILEQVTPIERTVGNPFQNISIPNLLETVGYTFSYYSNDANNLLIGNSYTIEDDIWILDCQQRLIPAYVHIIFDSDISGRFLFYGFGPRIGNVWTNDSSALILWKNDNKLYLIGHADSLSPYIEYNGVLYTTGVAGYAHTTNIVPVGRYFIDKNLSGITYIYNTSGSTIGAYGPDINNMVSGLSASISNALTRLSSIWS